MTKKRTADTMSEAIAQSSPSGHMSKAARKRADKRLELELFGPGGLKEIFRPTPIVLTNERKAELLRQRAADLRHLADGGMRPRVHRKEVARLEQEADDLDLREE